MKKQYKECSVFNCDNIAIQKETINWVINNKKKSKTFWLCNTDAKEVIDNCGNEILQVLLKEGKLLTINYVNEKTKEFAKIVNDEKFDQDIKSLMEKYKEEIKEEKVVQ